MKMKFSLTLATCLLGSSLFAANHSSLEKLQAQLEAIQNEINALKQEQAKQNEAVKADIADLQERTDETEFQAGLDKIKFGLDFSIAAGDTHFNSAKGTQDQQSWDAHNKWASELNLNMHANINDYTNFYGRLSMAKNWSQLDQTMNYLDTDSGRNTKSGASIYVSRAYVDLALKDTGFIFTLGRQPGTEGPGSNLRNNALRQATYPALMINVLGDAAVATYKPNALSDYNVAIRGAFGKVYQFDEEGDIRDWTRSGDVADSDLWYASAEGRLPLDSIGLGQNLLMLSWAKLHSLALPIPYTVVGNPTPIPLYLQEGVDNLGDADMVNLHFEAYNVFGVPLHYFTSFGYYKGSDAENLPIYAAGNVVAQQKLFNEKDAYAIHLGARYDFNRWFKLGGEYFYGSRFWYTLSRPSINDPLNIRTTRGHAFDFYGILQVDRNQFFRLSYTHINNKWGGRGTPLGGADPEELGGKSSADNVMIMYNVKF